MQEFLYLNVPNEIIQFKYIYNKNSNNNMRPIRNVEINPSVTLENQNSNKTIPQR